MDFKRALVRVLKGTFCKLIGRLSDAKRAYIEIDIVKYCYKIRFLVRVLLFPFCFYFLLFELPFFLTFWRIKVGFRNSLCEVEDKKSGVKWSIWF